jgi:hypothetical protein
MKKILTIVLLAFTLNANAFWGNDNMPWSNNNYNGYNNYGYQQDNGIFSFNPFKIFFIVISPFNKGLCMNRND